MTDTAIIRDTIKSDLTRLTPHHSQGTQQDILNAYELVHNKPLPMRTVMFNDDVLAIVGYGRMPAYQGGLLGGLHIDAYLIAKVSAQRALISGLRQDMERIISGGVYHTIIGTVDKAYGNLYEIIGFKPLNDDFMYYTKII